MRLLILLCTCVPALLFAQELDRSVVGSAGTYFSAVNVGNIHFTVGEISINRTENGMVLERGFHHGLYEFLSTGIWSSPTVDLNLSVYPNPTADRVSLTGGWERDDEVTITDLLGRRLLQQKLDPQRAQIDLTRYPSGTYLLTVLRNGRPLQTMRVVRR